MLFIPCEICTKPVNDAEVKQSLSFTEKVIGEGRVLCYSCRHSSECLAHCLSLVKSEVLCG